MTRMHPVREKHAKTGAVTLALAAALTLSACGGGGATFTSTTPIPPANSPGGNAPQNTGDTGNGGSTPQQQVQQQPQQQQQKPPPLAAIPLVSLQDAITNNEVTGGEINAYRFYGYGNRNGAAQGQGLFSAHKAGITGEGTTVGVFDSDFNQYSFEHSDLPRSRINFRGGGGLVEGGPDTRKDAAPGAIINTEDEEGQGGRGGRKHGLSVAGIVGAGQGGVGAGSVGVAPGTKLVILDRHSFSADPPPPSDSDCQPNYKTDKTLNCRELPAYVPGENLQYIVEGTRRADGVYNYFSGAPGQGLTATFNGIRNAFLDTNGNLRDKNLVAVNFSVAYLGPRAFLLSTINRMCLRRLTEPHPTDPDRKTSICITQPDLAGAGSYAVRFTRGVRTLYTVTVRSSQVTTGIRRMALAFEERWKQLNPDNPAPGSRLADAKFVDLKSVVEDLGKKGVVTVASAGNSRQEEWFALGRTRPLYETVAPSTYYPAFFAADPALKKYVLVVGALEGIGSSLDQITEWRQSFYSNGCGDLLKERCIFAFVDWYAVTGTNPATGAKIYERQGRVPLLQLGASAGESKVGEGSGTSFASPQVSGAIALLVDRFKPGDASYNGIRAADDLLNTAVLVEDTEELTVHEVKVSCNKGEVSFACRNKQVPTADGSVETEAVGSRILPTATGNGRMDILGALNIYGRPSAPTTTSVSGASLPLEGTRLLTGAAFGDALARAYGALSEAIVIDELGRAFKGELALRAAVSPARGVDDLLFAPMAYAGAAVVGHGRGAALSGGTGNIGDGAVLSLSGGTGNVGRDTLLSLSGGTGNVGRERDVALYLSGGSRGFVGADPSRVARGLFANEDFGASRLMSDAPEFSLAWRRGDVSDGERERTLWFAYSDAGMARRSDDSDARFEEPTGRRLLRFGGVEGVGERSRLRWEFGLLGEDEQVFGGVNEGILGMGAGSESRFVSLGLDRDLGDGWSVFGDVVRADVDGGGGGFLQGWRGVRARGWSMGVGRGYLDARGRVVRYGVRVSEPLRVYRGVLEMEHPVRILADGDTVRRERSLVSLEPLGRERLLEFAAVRGVSEGLSLEGRVVYRIEGGHLASASSEYGVMAGIRLRF